VKTQKKKKVKKEIRGKSRVYVKRTEKDRKAYWRKEEDRKSEG